MNARAALRLAAIAAAAFAAAVAAIGLWPGPDRPKTEEPVALVGGAFALVDQDGRRRTDAEFRGKHMLVFFGFTQCPDFCPTALYTITQALEKLGPKAERLAPIFVSVDPDRDTPAQLKNYAQNFDKRIVMLTGSAAEIAAVARAYRVYYAKRPLEKPGEYTMDHSAYIYLLDGDGKYLTHFRHAVPAEELAKALERRL